MVRAQDRISMRFRNPRGRGENDAIVYRGGSRGHYCIILVLTTRVSELRSDEVEKLELIAFHW